MKYGYCEDCMNKGMCSKCYRGTHYESAKAWYYNHSNHDNED